MPNPNIKLLVEVTPRPGPLVNFNLYKGAQLDASIITPERLFYLHNGTFPVLELEERAQSRILKCVMGECTEDISGKCTIQEAVELIRALNHTQEVKFILCE